MAQQVGFQAADGDAKLVRQVLEDTALAATMR
jgi:hypothetical protein